MTRRYRSLRLTEEASGLSGSAVLAPHIPRSLSHTMYVFKLKKKKYIHRGYSKNISLFDSSCSSDFKKEL